MRHPEIIAALIALSVGASCGRNQRAPVSPEAACEVRCSPSEAQLDELCARRVQLARSATPAAADAGPRAADGGKPAPVDASLPDVEAAPRDLPSDPPEPPRVPASCARLQACLELLAKGATDQDRERWITLLKTIGEAVEREPRKVLERICGHTLHNFAQTPALPSACRE